ncbi:hypothetical protein [Clostridium thermarum]|uniref:hypothetical protein n=1 Tax=Clostridium thermarum TaxID=1716543 RepID=UPI001121CC17|nr:hypothetical protein [Clostridium thermarum]
MSAKMRIVLQSVITVMLCILLIMILGYSKMRDVLLDNRIQFYSESIKLQRQNTEYFMKLIENITDYFIVETKLDNSLKENKYDSIVTNNLSNLRGINLDIIGSTVYSYNGQRYESNNIYNFPAFDIFSKSKEYQEFKRNGLGDMWIFCTDDIPSYNYTVKVTPDVISYIREVDYDKKPVGIIIVTIATSSFTKYFSYDSFNSDFTLSVYLPGRKLLYEYGNKNLPLPEQADLDKLIASGKGYMLSKGGNELIIAEKLLGKNTYIIKAVSLENFYAETHRLKVTFILIAAALSIILVLFYTSLADNILNPLMVLHDKIIKYRGQP